MRCLLSTALVLLFAASLSAQTLWSEDFANGLAGNNSSSPSAWTQDGADQLWAQDFDGPNGPYSNNTGGLASSTALNGFMIYDAGLANGSGPFVNKAGDLISPAIDLSSVSGYVTLEFEHAFRYCCSDFTSPIRVGISNNGGASWLLYDVRETATANVIKENPTTFKMVLHSHTPYGSNFKIKFAFGSSGNTHYYWEVDDVRLYQTPDHNLELINAYHHDPINKLNYTVTPISQLENMDFGADVENYGGQIQINGKLTVEVKKDGNQEYLGGSTTTSYGLGQRSIMWDNSTYMPSKVGVYDVHYSVENSPQVDDSPENNVADNSFEVSEVRWAKDLGVNKGSRLGNYNDNNSTPTPFTIANQFIPPNAGDSAYSISVAFESTTTVGEEVTARIYRYIGPTQQTGYLLVGQSNPFTISNAHLTTGETPRWVNIDFTAPVELQQGVEHLVGIYHNNTGSPRVYLIANGDNRDNGHRVHGNLGGLIQWYDYSESIEVPFIRLNVGEFLKANLGISQAVCPGTACDGAVTAYPYGGSGTYSYTWLDSLGNTIFGQTGNTMSNLCEGIYTVVVNDGQGRVDTATVELRPEGSPILPDFEADSTLLTTVPGTVTFTNLTPNMSEFDFLWVFGQGFSTSSDPTVDFTYVSCNSFDVRLKATSKATGCNKEEEKEDYISCVVGLDELQLPRVEFGVYPNPSAGDFTIHHNAGMNDNVVISVYNSLGHVVHYERVSGSTEIRVNLTKEPAGIYAVQLEVGGIVSTQMLMKE